MHRTVTLLFLMTMIPAARAADTEDARLAEFFKQYLEKQFAAHPLDATRNGDHRFDHLLDDLSAKARAADKERIKVTLADLPRRVDKAKLSRNGQIDYEILEHQLQYDLWQIENTRRFEQDPRLQRLHIGERICALDAIDPAA